MEYDTFPSKAESPHHVLSRIPVKGIGQLIAKHTSKPLFFYFLYVNSNLIFTVSIYIAKRAGQIFAFLSRSICLDIILQNSHFPVNLISHMNLVLSENNVESVIVLVPGFFSILADLADPALWCFNVTHLDSCQCLIQLLCNWSHLFHSTWEADFFAMIYNLANW